MICEGFELVALALLDVEDQDLTVQEWVCGKFDEPEDSQRSTRLASTEVNDLGAGKIFSEGHVEVEVVEHVDRNLTCL